MSKKNYPHGEGWLTVKATLVKGATVTQEQMLMLMGLTLESAEVAVWRHGKTVVTCTARKKKGLRTTVVFQDFGQDLLEMDIVDNIIVDARPYHKNVFSDCEVVNEPKVGGYLTYMYGIEESTIKYKIVDIKTATDGEE